MVSSMGQKQDLRQQFVCTDRRSRPCRNQVGSPHMSDSGCEGGPQTWPGMNPECAVFQAHGRRSHYHVKIRVVKPLNG